MLSVVECENLLQEDLVICSFLGLYVVSLLLAGHIVGLSFK